MTIATLLWPRTRGNYSNRAVYGRAVDIVLTFGGAIPLAIELYYHRYWPHIETFTLVWIAMAAAGRFVRFALARE